MGGLLGGRDPNVPAGLSRSLFKSASRPRFRRTADQRSEAGARLPRLGKRCVCAGEQTKTEPVLQTPDGVARR